MLALLLIPILVSGYIMIVLNPYHYFRLHRHDGQLLYLKVATYGTFCLFCTTVIGVLIKFLLPNFHLIDLIAKNFTLTGDKKNDHIYALLTLLSVTSILFSWIYVFFVWVKNYILGYFYSKKHLATYNNICQAKNARVLRKTLSNGTIDCMLLDALESTPKRPVLINLSSKKVYIGIISGLSDPNEKEEPNKYISFFPVMSGYRDKDTMLLEFTNVYPSKIKDLNIVVSTDEISHISWFDFKLYNSVNNSAAKEEKRNTKIN
ncbi:hypothetical protein WH390_03075 [Candidatus Arsenophonus nilaparvatae]|uniref:hypothetical protein n=1 Tax=Candidatus Arsenophonus nilaparvatae TaxID=1247023 RepID=UPI00068A514A|nr:hypothetical protein [Candidatus Arsenophonus nilaparvatae]